MRDRNDGRSALQSWPAREPKDRPTNALRYSRLPGEDGPHPGRRAWASGSGCRRNIGETRSEEHTSELQSLMRISYAVFCLKKKHQEKETGIAHVRTPVTNAKSLLTHLITK